MDPDGEAHALIEVRLEGMLRMLRRGMKGRGVENQGNHLVVKEGRKRGQPFIPKMIPSVNRRWMILLYKKKGI